MQRERVYERIPQTLVQRLRSLSDIATPVHNVSFCEIDKSLSDLSLLVRTRVQLGEQINSCDEHHYRREEAMRLFPRLVDDQVLVNNLPD